MGPGLYAAVISCPGCGRTTSTVFQDGWKIQGYVRERMPEWRENYVGVEEMQLAVAGCIVNGSAIETCGYRYQFARTGEVPTAPVFIDGETDDLARRGPGRVIPQIVEDYVSQKYEKRV